MKVIFLPLIALLYTSTIFAKVMNAGYDPIIFSIYDFPIYKSYIEIFIKGLLSIFIANCFFGIIFMFLALLYPNKFFMAGVTISGLKSLTNKYMPTLVDEEIISELRGDAFNLSPNIFARFFGMIEKIISWLLTVPKIAHIIVTNKRVIVIEARRFLWFFTWSVTSDSYAPKNVVKYGYAMLRSYIFFRSHYLTFGVHGENLLIKSDEGKIKVDQVNQAIAQITN
jgi:hypothetical protein